MSLENVRMNNIELEPTNQEYPVNRIRSRQSIHSISWKWPFIFLGIGCGLLYVIHLIDYKLPRVVTENEAIENPQLFSAERSRQHLEKLVSFGQRVVGSDANEKIAPEYIEQIIQNITHSAHPSQHISYDLQTGTGDFNLGFKPPFTNVYVNINNIIVKLEGSNDSHSVLLNCHYDSVPSSVGASDDAVNCGIMLEVLIVLSKAETRLQHSIVFLFNGAEETVLMAAHLFLKHEWSKNVRCFLNLEAGGLGGRAILFQSGPRNSWLLNYYARYAPHPHGQIFGEELFQSGAVPSDTDFRIFRDFGNLPGLDFAFSRNGYVYHTIYDRAEYIESGSIQHLGDNIVSVLRELGNAPEFNDVNRNNDGEMVYFDYLGWFMVRYSKSMGIFINIVILAVSVFSVIVFVGRLSQWSWLPNGLRHIILWIVRRGRLRDAHNDLGTTHAASELKHTPTPYFTTQAQAYNELSFSTVAILCGMVCCVLVNALMGVLVDSISAYSMPFYSKTYLIFFLYWIPGLLAYLVPIILMDLWREKKRGLSLSLTCQLNLISAQIPFMILLFILTCANVRSSCIIAIGVLFSALANLTIHLTQLYRKVHRWMWVYLILHIPASVIQVYCTLLLYSLFIPIMGRSGPVNADLYIAVVSGILIIYTMSFAVPLFLLVRRKGLVMDLLSVMCIVSLILCIFSTVIIPYRKGPGDPAPQRYWIMHTHRQFHLENGSVPQDSGYFILNLDRNSPRTIPHHLRQDIRSMKEDCDTKLLCGAPLYTSRMTVISETSSWIPAPVPIISDNTTIQVDGKICGDGVCEYTLTFRGPDRMTVMLSPREAVDLVAWNLSAPVMPCTTWKNRQAYFLHLVYGRVVPFTVKFTFKVPNEMTTSPIFDISLVGNHVHHEDLRTSEFKKFLAGFPDYVTMTAWISSYKAFTF